jgi:branched-chain amino acid transport system permease protein
VILAAIAALALNLVMGHAGLVSVGNAALLATGGFGAVEASVYLHLSFPVAVLCGGLLSAVVGLVVALPAYRISGLYFAIATLAAHFIVLFAIHKLQVGQIGENVYIVDPAAVGGLQVTSPGEWLLLLLVVLGVVIAAYRTLLVRKPGRVWRAIREEPLMAVISGIRPGGYKISAFVLSSFIIGIAGALTVYYTGVFTYEAFSLNTAIFYITMVVLGGMGSIYGPLVGALALTILPKVLPPLFETLNLSNLVGQGRLFLVQGALIGVILTALIVFQPRGLAAIGQQLINKWQATRASGTNAPAASAGEQVAR